jgi:D-glycero-alpha-D-manno-heptose-7-phosphate kinase
MILSKCPLRISLVGGSTDSQEFIKKYKNGCVISFTPNIYTYITIHENNTNKYIINYSNKEVVDDIEEIKNDIVRESLKHFNTSYCTITFNSNIQSSGSGLASSSSYTISLIKALCLYHKIFLTDIEICNLAFNIEKTFNPLSGFQDVYGCGMSGFKRIDFNLNKPHSYRYLDMSHITDVYDMYLLNTNIVRSSTDILKTIDIEKSYKLLELVDKFENCIIEKDTETFFKLFNDGWNIKKTTSHDIMNNKELLKIDSILQKISGIKGYKLCGAGGGGYFFMFVDKKQKNFLSYMKNKLYNNVLINVKIDNRGIQGINL